MVMNPLTIRRPKLQSSWLKYFLAETYNFENATLLAGSLGLERFVDTGTVLGQVNQGAVTVGAAVANAGNTGNGTVALGSPAYGANARVGYYQIVFVSATEFEVYRPTVDNLAGDLIGVGVAGTAFKNEIAFTVTAGGTAFVAGDGFSIPVSAAAGGGQYVPLGVAAGVTNGVTASGNAVLHFAAVPAALSDMVARGQPILVSDLTSPAVIPLGTTVLSITATTVTMSGNAAGAGVGSGDSIAFTAQDGSQNAVAIAVSPATALAGTDLVNGMTIMPRGPAVISLDSVNGLIWPAGSSAAQQSAALAQLAALSIIGRQP
jgi:hypothetical protein